MRIKIDGGFVEATKNLSGKIGLSIGCEHFNPDGTRKDTVVNTVSLSEEELVKLFSDIFKKDVESAESTD